MIDFNPVELAELQALLQDARQKATSNMRLTELTLSGFIHGRLKTHHGRTENIRRTQAKIDRIDLRLKIIDKLLNEINND